MKSTVEHLNPTRVKLSVEVPFDELKPHFAKAYGALAGTVNIPGFRKGKVPARILDARLGRGTILSEVVNDAVPAKYGEAVAEANLTPLGQPEIEVTRIDDGDTLAFTAEVDVRPEIVLPAVDEISVVVDDVEVTEADIDEQVEALRDRFATITPVERAAADGDSVTIDLRAVVDGEELPDASTDGLTYKIGTGDLVDGLDEAITGLSAGETATFTTSLVAGDHSGEDAEVTVTLNGVSERALPEVDDDFAQLASEFDTVAEMRADLVERIQRVKNMTQGSQARDKVLEALLEATDIPAPAGIVESEYEARQHDAVHSFDHSEEQFNAYLEGEGQTREEFDAETRAASEEAVRTQLLLDALAEQQGVGVSQEEFTERIIYNAQRFGVSPDEYFKRLQEGNQLGAVIADVRRGKALANAVQLAKISDASGNTLNVAELFGVEEIEDEDEATAQDIEDGVIEGGVIEGASQDVTETDDAVVEEGVSAEQK
ncbi:trigger factor [Nakamurella sp. UYEF19]|uniref:trigger factor n=1 Tax=Nakamurella sp. UYEF19 TaxID=1756392 RepID=UPI003396F9D3